MLPLLSGFRFRIASSAAVIAAGLLCLFGCGNLLPMPQQGGAGGGAAPNAAPGNPAPVPGQTVPPAPPGVPAPGAAAPGQTSMAAASGPVAGAAALYGDQMGETNIAADPQIPDALLHSRKDDTFYKLSNPRMEQGRFGRPLLKVDYEKSRVGKTGGPTMILHSGDGTRDMVSLSGGYSESRGTIQVEFQIFGFNNQVPKNMEIFLISYDGRYGAKAPRFKISNSVVMGQMPKPTPVRHWTAEELKLITSPPPNYTNPNAHPGIGTDTKLVGTEGGGQMRYVEPGGKLLGIEFRLGEWDQVKCLGGMVPIFTRDQPTTISDRVIAREGYAVAGMNVQSTKFVNAVHLVYAKVAPNGTLDMKDTYDGDWIGYPGEATPEKLGGSGRTIIGLNLKQGGVLNMVGLVEERK